MVNKTIINMKITITKDIMILDNNNNPYKKYRIHKKWSRMNKYLLKIKTTKKISTIKRMTTKSIIRWIIPRTNKNPNK